MTLRHSTFALLLVACTPTPEDEQAMGDRFAREIETQVTLSTDHAEDAYVDSLALRIVRSIGQDDRPWAFSVVRSDEVNAFAIPGGHVYVHDGLIRRVGSMPELAGVLAHEIGHVVLRHSAQQMSKRSRANFAISAFCQVTGWCEGTAAQVAINVGGAAWFARHSRQDESEADSVAVGYLLAAGIDPAGVPAFFDRLARDGGGGADILTAWLGSHPVDEARLASTRRLVEQVPDSIRRLLQRSDTRFPADSARAAGR